MSICMEQIAEYFEKTFRIQKTITLFPDKITVRGKVVLQQDFQMEIPLKNMNPLYQQIAQRDCSFWAGIYMMVIPGVILTALHSIWKVSWVNLASCLMLVFTVSGGVLCLATIKKVTHYTFTNLAGIPVLSIAKPKKTEEEFESFISDLIDSIKKAKD